MNYRPLGGTGIRISEVSFGAGPVPALLTRDKDAETQAATVRRAIESGINWFDTAATYGDGRSESSLGAALAELRAGDVHIATKVRLSPDKLDDISSCVLASVESSLQRLRRPRVTLIQLHNSVTARRGDQPTSITPADVLGPRGVLAAFDKLRRDGKATYFGLTGLGDVGALREVVRSGSFATIQVPYHLLNPSAGSDLAPEGIEADYGNIIGECQRMGMGALAIRVFAGGALVGQPPSEHTKTTKFFPLALYERDLRRAAALENDLPADLSLKELAVRFVLNHPGVSSAIVGFSSPEQVDEVLSYAARGPLPAEMAAWLQKTV